MRADRNHNKTFERAITAGLAACTLTIAGIAMRPQLADHTPLPLEHTKIIVNVDGEVLTPGTYELPWGSRAKDAITLAGGLTTKAERSLVNDAAPLEDGDQLVIPSREINAKLGFAKTQTTSPERVNLNSASLTELDALPGVGPAFAARIVAARPFSGWADLDRVKGVGSKMLERLKPLVRF